MEWAPNLRLRRSPFPFRASPAKRPGFGGRRPFPPAGLAHLFSPVLAALGGVGGDPTGGPNRCAAGRRGAEAAGAGRKAARERIPPAPQLFI